MNVITVAQDYVLRMLGSKSAAGMKVLLMDVETAGIVSLVVNQSTALQKEVYLFERIDNPKRESLLHLRCIAFLRPTHENFRLLQQELADPKYREYHLCLFFFSPFCDVFLIHIFFLSKHSLLEYDDERSA